VLDPSSGGFFWWNQANGATSWQTPPGCVPNMQQAPPPRAPSVPGPVPGGGAGGSAPGQPPPPLQGLARIEARRLKVPAIGTGPLQPPSVPPPVAAAAAADLPPAPSSSSSLVALGEEVAPAAAPDFAASDGTEFCIPGDDEEGGEAFTASDGSCFVIPGEEEEEETPAPAAPTVAEAAPYRLRLPAAAPAYDDLSSDSSDDEDEAAMEARLRRQIDEERTLAAAARQRSVDHRGEFKAMLLEMSVQPYSNFDKLLSRMAFDKRFLGVVKAERRELFQEYARSLRGKVAAPADGRDRSRSPGKSARR